MFLFPRACFLGTRAVVGWLVGWLAASAASLWLILGASWELLGASWGAGLGPRAK